MTIDHSDQECLALTLTFTVSGTTTEDLREHAESLEEELCRLLEENNPIWGLRSAASLERIELKDAGEA